ncbi:NUDIX hydrolase [Ponticaulis profundi]|uniref:NUDIX hydrolase n=1 Tax=Ponticaulis profundi TaxID=2665222 RepID=UPI00366EE16B
MKTNDPTPASRPAAPIKPAATVIVVRSEPRLEVLMVQRSNSGMFANALVFPGGMLEQEDSAASWEHLLSHSEPLDPKARSLRISAIREVWEETGILLCDEDETCPPTTPSNEAGAFKALVQSQGLTLDLDAVTPFSNWITPPGAPKRYDTHFFLVHFAGSHRGISDGVETTHLTWQCPHDLLARHEREDIDLLLPTLGNLQLLVRSDTVEGAITDARNRTITPVIPVTEMRDGVPYVAVPAGTPFGNVAMTAARMTKPRKVFK